MSTYQQKYDVFLRGISGESLIAPEVVTPAQFFDRARPTPSPEHQLMFAVMSQAFDDLARYGLASNPAGREIFAAAYDWVMSDEEGWPCSFLRLCESLRLAPGPIRAWTRKNYAPYRALRPIVHLGNGPRPVPEVMIPFAPACCVGRSNQTIRYRLANNRVVNIGVRAIQDETTAWMPGEVGTLVLTERYARSRGLHGEAPPRLSMRHVGGNRQHSGGLHKSHLTMRAKRGAA